MRNLKLKSTAGDQRGDTLVEVLIAITVMGVIVAGSLAMMNRALVSIINSTERTAVRAQVNSQTELLTYIRDNDSGTWQQIKELAFTPSGLGQASADCTLNPDSKISQSGVPAFAGSFYLAPHSDLSGATLVAGLQENVNGQSPLGGATAGEGIWVDAVYYASGVGNITTPYFDFYVKACWTPLGSLPDQHTTTVIRIYDSRS